MKCLARLFVLPLLTVSVVFVACGSDSGNGDPADLNLDFSIQDTAGDQTPPSDSVYDTAPDSATDLTADLPADLPPDIPVVCTPGERQCQNLLTPGECNETGTGWILLNQCSEGYTCYAETASCAKKICQPGSRECVDEGSFKICKIDGSGWGEVLSCEAPSTCSSGLCISPGCLPKVMFLVDRSTSMGPSWEGVQNSIKTVVAQNQGVQFGLTVFPSEGGFFAGCTMEPDAPHIPIQDNAAPLIDAWFADNEPAGATPLLTAIKWVRTNTVLIWGNPPENAYLVLLSDGEDKCACSQYENDPEKRDECVAEKLLPEIQAITAMGVKTFVIGYNYGGPDKELKTIAENGGTEYTDWIYAGSEASLTEAFGKLIDDVKWCM